MTAKTRRRLLMTLSGAGAVVLIATIFQPVTGRGALTSSHTSEDAAALYPAAFHAERVEPVRGPNVLLISIDTLRADHMSLYGYTRATTPRIDAFAAQARVFERAYATASFTSPSVASMLTGVYPYRHGVRLLWQKYGADDITVADHLRRVGYQTAAVVSNIVIGDAATGLGSRFDHFDDEVLEPPTNRRQLLERRAPATTDAALNWLETSRKTDAPFFLWVHYMDPHGPYDPPEDAPADFSHDEPIPVDPTLISKSVIEPGLVDGAEYIDRYDEEIAYTDRAVGRLLDRFEALGLADDAIIVLTADHGEYMMESADYHFTHAMDVGEGVIHIPLLIRGKGLPVHREARPVSLADVMPTILDATGVPIPENLDGRSLLGEIATRPPYAEGKDSGGSGGLHRAFIYADRKVVLQHGRSNIPRRAWTVELNRDNPDNTVFPIDIADPAYVVLEQLTRSDPDPGGQPAHYVKGDEPAPLVAEGVDEETLRNLKSLGYVN